MSIYAKLQIEVLADLIQHYVKGIIYSLDVLLFLFRTSLLFHVQFCFFLTYIQVSQEAGQVVWYYYFKHI